MQKYVDMDSTREFPCFDRSCKSDSCARGIRGGMNGAAIDEHGGNRTEIEAELRCVGTGWTPRAEKDRGFDTCKGEGVESFVSEKVSLSDALEF